MASALRILHLEDDPSDTELMVAILREDGIECDVTRVDTRDEFLQSLRDGHFDVVISDITVPGFGGIAAQDVWKRELPHVPFIFLSGTFGEEIAVERLREGATDYVLKKWMAKLPGVVRRALGEMRERVARQQAQSALQSLNAELEKRVEERTVELRAANRALEHANVVKNEFLSRISHELRTPLNAVLGFAQLLDMDNLTPDQRESVLQILEAGRHLRDLTDEALDFSGGDPSRVPLPAIVPKPEVHGAGTVLYIEDNPSNVRLLERVLKQRRPGVTLLNAGAGESGVEMAVTHLPDLILLDLHLPDTHGEEVLRRLGADSRTRNIPVAVLSADATQIENRRLLAAGAIAYLTKPLDMLRLLELLDERLT
jgi:CheY-like chemotaxis protein